jgi:hypothetical protein
MQHGAYGLRLYYEGTILLDIRGKRLYLYCMATSEERAYTFADDYRGSYTLADSAESQPHTSHDRAPHKGAICRRIS